MQVVCVIVYAGCGQSYKNRSEGNQQLKTNNNYSASSWNVVH